MTRIVVLPNENLCPEGAVVDAEPGESVCRALLRNHIDIDGTLDLRNILWQVRARIFDPHVTENL